MGHKLEACHQEQLPNEINEGRVNGKSVNIRVQISSPQQIGKSLSKKEGGNDLQSTSIPKDETKNEQDRTYSDAEKSKREDHEYEWDAQPTNASQCCKESDLDREGYTKKGDHYEPGRRLIWR